MKKKIYLIAIISAIVLLIAVASLLYNSLQDGVTSNQLEVFETPEPVVQTSPTAQPEEAEIPTPVATPESEAEPPTEKPSEAPEATEKPSEAPAETPSVKATEAPATPEAEKEESKNKDMPLAPDCKIYDKNENAVMLSSLLGKPTVLNFWASWCGPCMSEMPDFERKYKEIGADVNFLMVNMTDGTRETFSKASQFVKEAGYTFPVYYDKSSSAANTYSVYSIPTTYFIDADGHIIARASGAIDYATLQKGIDMIR